MLRALVDLVGVAFFGSGAAYFATRAVRASGAGHRIGAGGAVVLLAVLGVRAALDLWRSRSAALGYGGEHRSTGLPCMTADTAPPPSPYDQDQR